jgi:hypothetical protein
MILPGIRPPGMMGSGKRAIYADALAPPLNYPPSLIYIPRDPGSGRKRSVYRFFMFNYGN